MPELHLRPEGPADYAAVEFLTREAFWNVYKPGCDEHYLLHQLRRSPGYLPALHLLALQGEQIVGSIVYSRSHIEGADGRFTDTLTFGPLSVLPAWQGQGIGSRLVLRTLDMARQQGERAVLIMGHPAYYHRFGFRPAADYGIVLPGGSSPPPFMALELYPGALQGVSGIFREDEAFLDISEEAVEAFDRAFPPRVKERRPGQLV